MTAATAAETAATDAETAATAAKDAAANAGGATSVLILANVKKNDGNKKLIEQLEKAKSKKLTYNEKYEYDNILKEIAILEDEKKKLEIILLNPEVDIEKITNSSKRLGELVTLIDSKEMRWLELDSK